MIAASTLAQCVAKSDWLFSVIYPQADGKKHSPRRVARRAAYLISEMLHNLRKGTQADTFLYALQRMVFVFPGMTGRRSGGRRRGWGVRLTSA